MIKKNMTFNTKLLFTLLFPILGMLYFSIGGIDNKSKMSDEMDKLQELSTLAVKISMLIHETQIERGETSGFLGSEGENHKLELRLQILQTDKKVLELKNFLRDFHSKKFGSIFNNMLDRSNIELGKINDIREAVSGLKISTAEAINYYTNMNANFLSIISYMVKVSSNSEVSIMASCYINFLLAKEGAGIERAVGNRIFSSHMINSDIFDKFTFIVNTQKNYISVFLSLSNEEQKDFFKKKMSSEIVKEVQQMRKILSVNLEKMQFISELESYIGYGGLIHQFKNYLLRGQKKYKDKFSMQYGKITRLIDKFKNLQGLSEKDLKGIQSIQDTFDLYNKAIKTIISLKNQNIPIVRIDKVVKIDDGPAITALNFLSKGGDFGVESKNWFKIMTGKINLLKEVENKLLADLSSRTEHLGQKAKQSLFFYYLISFILVLTTGSLSYFGLISEINRRNIMEGELKTSYSSILELKEKTEVANKLKSQFLANMSHDIRTPLNAIMGFTDLLLKNANRIESKLYLTKVKSAGDGLLNLINDILDFSKIEAGQIDVFFRSFYIKELFKGIIDMFEIQFQNKDLEFESFLSSNVPDIVYNDKLRIKQVLANLLSNALKFTIKGKVSLHIDYRSKQDVLVLKIKDSGIGIPLKNQDRIFEPFTQLERENGFSEKGAGLGLAICNKLVQLMGGTISVSSTQGKGAEFIFEIPANSKKAKENPVFDVQIDMGESNLNEKKGNKILIADDNPVNMELITQQLKNVGFNDLLSAVNGKEAVKLAIEHSPDLILMDIQMPVMDGNEAINWLKKEGYKGPIIVLSAFAMREDIEKSLTLGAVAYITKPIDFNTFFDKIASFLGKKENSAPITTPDKLKHRRAEEPQYKIKDSVSERMKNIFLTDLGNKLKTISEVLKEDELGEGRQKLRIIAHGYLGNADYFGLSELTASSNELEQAIEKDEPDQKVISLSEVLNEILKEIYKLNKYE